ncbi:Uncharacterised protein [Mycobacteroides abscessus subsp. abscessus]|nr:Uncharacterised protein [Mycobacteroides abscessus subsp. abscessus]
MRSRGFVESACVVTRSGRAQSPDRRNLRRRPRGRGTVRRDHSGSHVRRGSGSLRHAGALLEHGGDERRYPGVPGRHRRRRTSDVGPPGGQPSASAHREASVSRRQPPTEGDGRQGRCRASALGLRARAARGVDRNQAQLSRARLLPGRTHRTQQHSVPHVEVPVDGRGCRQAA